MHIFQNWSKYIHRRFGTVNVNFKTNKMTNATENLYNKINTFVFFDLETTDLIRGSKMPKITELSMVAVDRDSIVSNRNKLSLPRIMHKLTIPICPNRAINYKASQLSNLWNDNLLHIKPFDCSTYDIIMQFIERLPGVICFVAHNGNSFDYPVFLSEIGNLKKTFPDTILCIDTLIAFQEFFNDKEEELKQPTKQQDEVDGEQLVCNSSEKINRLLDDGMNDVLYNVLDKFEHVVQETDNIKPLQSTSNNVAVQNDTTVDTDLSSSFSNTPISKPHPMQVINEKTPENQIVRKNCSKLSVHSYKSLKGVKKQLNFDESSPKNLKLSTLYRHLIGCEAESLHCAESDCISMLRCVCQIGQHFTEWADCNAVSLNLFDRINKSSAK